MNKANLRSSRSAKILNIENGSEQDDLDLTIQNISHDNMEDGRNTLSDAVNSSSEHIWILINQRLEELEKQTQRIIARDKRHREQQEAEKERTLQKRLAALENRVSRSLEATTTMKRVLGGVTCPI